MTAAVAVAMLSSCKKIQNCECTITYTYPGTTYSGTETIAMNETKGKAKKVCEQQQSNYTADLNSQKEDGIPQPNIYGKVTCVVK